MDLAVDACLKDMTESASQLKSVDHCIEEGELQAARKLLKRHFNWIDGTTSG